MAGASKAGKAGGPAAGVFNLVNPHCLESIVSLSEHEEVIAAEDIHDANGMKLWAKGYPVNRSLQEKLLRRRLAKPMEATLTIEAGATPKTILADCVQLMADNPALGIFAGWSDAKALLRGVGGLNLPAPVKLLLTSARQQKQSTYAHSLGAMIVCAGIASRLKLSEHDASLLIFSALVHDIGEMYINPAYLDGSRPLAAHEWKYVASHPRVGQAFIREFTSFPSVVADCVLHHHERLDGSGYPFQVAGGGLGRLSTLLAVADSVSAIVSRGGSGLRERIAVALRIVPEEFDRAAVSAIDETLRGLDDGGCEEGAQGCLARVVPALGQLAAARAAAEALADRAPSTQARDSAHYVLSVLANVQKSLRATGVYETSQLAQMEGDTRIMGEICMILREVSWRLRNLARNVYLRTESGGEPKELEYVAEMVAALDGTTQAEPAVIG